MKITISVLPLRDNTGVSAKKTSEIGEILCRLINN